MEQINSTTRRGRVGHGVAHTLTTSPQQAVVERKTISYTRKHPPHETDVSTCLQAGYHKGFSDHNPYPAVVELSFVNGDICRTVRTGGHGSTDRHSWDMVQCNNTLRIRKLTPKECFRLQGFNDSDFKKAEAVNSNTQLYKQAGNSICVPVVEYIISALIDSGVFGGQAKQPVMFAEGQLSFADCASFDRYMDYYRKGE